MNTAESMTAIDPFTLEIIRSYLVSAVREMHETTMRTAYSTCLSEGEDFTCALFDARGRMIAQANGSPAHSGALVDAVDNIRAAYDRFYEGDVILHNDPYNGGTHQADVVVCRPIFVNKAMIGFAINRGHWTDIGGMAAGGWSGTARHVIQEALLIPPSKLYNRGRVSREIKEFVLRNVRIPEQCWGDIQSQIACTVVAERRLRLLVDKYGLDAVNAAMETALDYSRRRFAQALRNLPDGVWNGSEVMEDDADGLGPYEIMARVTKKDDHVVVDFGGTAGQVLGAVNCSFSATKASTINALLAVVEPFTPINSGLLELIDIRAPAGTLVNPVYPAPVFCAADPANKAGEAVLRALAQMAPDRVTAGTYCTGNNVTGSGELDGSSDAFLWYIYEAGGCGARRTKDGNNVLWHFNSNAKNESMEIWEARYPVLFEGYGLVTDSGGAGKSRGGLGSARQIRMLADTQITGTADRHRVPPWGLAGGGVGMVNKFRVTRDGVEYDLQTLFHTPSRSKFAHLPLKAGDVFSVIQGGGGGYGDPFDRDPRVVEQEVRNGYVSCEHAREAYGVLIDPVTQALDEAGTSALRKDSARQSRLG